MFPLVPPSLLMWRAHLAQVQTAATQRGLDSPHTQAVVDKAADTLHSVASGDSASAAALSSSLTSAPLLLFQPHLH